MSNLPQRYFDSPDTGLIEPKRGAAIFEGTNYPRDWTGFVGQADAVESLQVAIASAAARKTRLDHTLFASGIAGVGKTTLATMLAYHLGVGFQQCSGPLTIESFRRLVRPMRDGDILFSDEIHRMVQGNRNRADWLLPWMLGQGLQTERGVEHTANVVLVGATTDWGKLPDTLRDRFLLQPTLGPYTEAEAGQIAVSLAGRMNVELGMEEAPLVATAADSNPRVMERILTTLRDHQAAGVFQGDWDTVFRRSKVTEDGLSTLALDMLIILSRESSQTASIETIKGRLNEPGPLRHPEHQLLQREYIEISGQGRRLTTRGLMRVRSYRRSA